MLRKWAAQLKIIIITHHTDYVMKPFPRRIYVSPFAFWRDFRFILANRPILRKAMHGNLISPAFRERLMLVVTEVNGCRYCSYFHAQQALKAGVSHAELKDLLTGMIPVDCPPQEYSALLYAQHWAELDAQPIPEATRRLVESYGQEEADAIQLILRMIRVGNLLGNTGDYWLYQLSFGKIGLRRHERTSGSTA